LEYVIRKTQENQVGLELNETHQQLVSAAVISLLGNNISTIKENTETPLEVSRDVDLEINAEKTEVYDHVLSSKFRTEPEYKDS
jgi:hypothetical protein